MLPISLKPKILSLLFYDWPCSFLWIITRLRGMNFDNIGPASTNLGAGAGGGGGGGGLRVVVSNGDQ